MIDTLRSICEQCTHLKKPQLDFIPEELSREREIILRDLKELVSAASAELEKGVVVLAGGLIEAVLYSFIQGQEAYIAQRRGEFTFDPNLSLQNYKDIFNRWFLDQIPNAQLPDFVVTYRDIVHINHELNLPTDVGARASRTLLRILNTLSGELAKFAGPVNP